MLKNIFWALFNSTLPSLMAFFTVIFIARVISPDDYLKIALLISYFGIVNVLIDGGLSQRLLLKPNLREKTLNYVQSLINFRSILVLLFTIALLLFSGRYEEYTNLELCIGILIPLIFAYNFQQNLLFNRNRLFKEKTIISCYSSIVAALFSAAITLVGYPKIGMLLLNVISVAILSVLMRLKLQKQLFGLPAFAWAYSTKSFVNYSFFSQMLERADDFTKRTILDVLSVKLPTAELSRIETLLNSPIKLINKALERVVLSSWGPLKKSQIKGRSIYQYYLSSLLTSLTIATIITVLGSDIIVVLIGDRWNISNELYLYIGCVVALRYFGSQVLHVIKSTYKNFFISFYANLSSSLILIMPLVMFSNTLQGILLCFFFAYTVRALIALAAAIFMNILQSKPRLVIHYGTKVYKIISIQEMRDESNIENLRNYLSIYNKSKTKDYLSIKVPDISYGENILTMPFLPFKQCSKHEHYIQVYKTIGNFSDTFAHGGQTVSLGDFQVKNIFLTDVIYAIDLGKTASSYVPTYYDRARFIINLIDSGIFDAAILILTSEKDNQNLQKQLVRRARYLVIKRLRAKRFFSAFYRFFVFALIRFKT